METFIYDDEFKQRLRESPHSFGEVSFLDPIAEAGMTAIDVGANKGVTTVALEDLWKPPGGFLW